MPTIPCAPQVLTPVASGHVSGRFSWRDVFSAYGAVHRRNRALLRVLLDMPDWQLDDMGLTRDAIVEAYVSRSGPLAPTGERTRA